jgi:hypothetical protein
MACLNDLTGKQNFTLPFNIDIPGITSQQSIKMQDGLRHFDLQVITELS